MAEREASTLQAAGSVPALRSKFSDVILLGPGPYTARSASDRTDDWPFWYVTNNGRTNILRFHSHPTALFTSRAEAEDIAAHFNI